MDKEIINKISFNLVRIEGWLQEIQQILISLSLEVSPGSDASGEEVSTYVLKFRCLNCGYMWFGEEKYGRSWDASCRVCAFCGVSNYVLIQNPRGWNEGDRSVWEKQCGR